MAEFKPIKCTKAQMDAKAKSEGQLFFCTDTGHIYLDISSSNRMILNANKAIQDSAGQQINTTYIKNLSLNTSTNKLTYTKGNGSTGNIDLPYTTKEYVDKLEYQLNYEPLKLTFYNSMPSNMIGSMLDIGADISLSPGSGDVYFFIQAPITDMSYGGLLISVSEDFDGTITVEEVSGSMTYELSDRTIQIGELDMSYPFKFKMIINCDATSGPNSQIFIRRVADFNADTSTNSTQYLSVRNQTEYVPTADYHPATKKYVDSAITNINSTLANREVDILFKNNVLQTYNLMTNDLSSINTTISNNIKSVNFKGIPTTGEYGNYSNLFYNSKITSIDNLDTSKVTNLHQTFRFSYLPFIPGLCLDNCTNLQGTFSDSQHLLAIGPINLGDNVQIKNIYRCFANSRRLREIDLSFNTRKPLINITSAFENCKSLNFSAFNIIQGLNSNYIASSAFRNSCIDNILERMPKEGNYMYSYCTNLKSINGYYNSRMLVNAQGMFSACFNLENVILNDLLNLQQASIMFQNCHNLTSVTLTNTSNLRNISSMFEGCNNLHTLPELNLSNIVNVANFIEGCSNLYPNQINTIYNMLMTVTNISNVTSSKSLNNKNYGILYHSQFNWANFSSAQQANLTTKGWTH